MEGTEENPLKKEMGRSRARHELSIADFLLGLFLSDVYRHDLKKNHLIFGAIAFLTQNINASWVHTIPMLLSTCLCFNLKIY
jgi:hypothetical protein